MDQPCTLGRLERTFVFTAKGLLAAIALVAIAINIVNAIGRTFFSAPLEWAEEVLAYIFLWAIFVGSSLLMLNDHHIRIDLATTFLPKASGQFVKALMMILTGIFCLYIATFSFEVVESALRSGRRSVVTSIPMSIAHGSLLLGFVFMGLFGTVGGAVAFRKLAKKNKESR